MKVFVTGGAGFVGSHIVDQLVEWGHDVTTIDDLSSGKRFNLNPKARFLQEDIFTMDPVVADVVIHCAAKADISENWVSRYQRVELYEHNIDRTIDILESCGKGKIGAFVFISTAAVYGNGATSLDADAHLLRAKSPYAATKLAGEAFVHAYAERFGWRWACARLVSCVGARYSHGHIADFVRMAKEGIIKTRDNGSSKKPYINVKTAAREIGSLAMNEELSGNHIVTGGMWGIRDTIAEMAKISPVQVQYSEADRGWVGDPQTLRLVNEYNEPSVVGGVREALRSLGWT